MKRAARLTRREKIERSAAIQAGVIKDPRHIKGLPPGVYTFTGPPAMKFPVKP